MVIIDVLGNYMQVVFIIVQQVMLPLYLETMHPEVADTVTGSVSFTAELNPANNTDIVVNAISTVNKITPNEIYYKTLELLINQNNVF